MLEIKNLSCGYGAGLILKDIFLQVAAGEVAGVIGPNGSGKTTLLRTITRALKPAEGAVFFAGVDIRLFSFSGLARKMALVSQNIEAEGISVEEFVLLGRIPHYGKFQFFETKNDLEVAERYMRLTGIFELRNRRMDEISGGERQLVFIAKALAQEPALLLLDEPTAHLDISHQVMVLDLVRKLNYELSLTVIMVLHDLNLASEYCNRLILVNGGRIIKDGVPEEVLTYRNIEQVYKTVVVVGKNPVSSKPYIVAVPGEKTKRV